MAVTSKLSNELVEAKQIEFQLKKYAVSKLGSFSAHKLRYDQQENPELMGMLQQLTTSVLSRQIVIDPYPVSFGYSYPMNTWQMFKKLHLPKWFKRRYPVKNTHKSITKTVTFERFATYPMADVKVPDNMGRVVFHDYARSY